MKLMSPTTGSFNARTVRTMRMIAKTPIREV
jgi:hypothetical protein